MECIFCKIISKQIPCYNVYEDDLVLAFLDINPDSIGHMLIVPKKHIININDMDSSTWNHILDIAKKMKHLLEDKLNIDGLTLIQNNGDIQEVKHFHLHLKPFYKVKKEMDINEVYDILKG